LHDASPLKGSLDPGELGENGRVRRGVHFVGGEDSIVPSAVVERFVRRMGGRMERMPGYDHDCCWLREWPALLRTVADSESAK
jgi:hypothetical protein